MEMDERKKKILQAIITDYIHHGEPIGSRTIAKKYDLGVSSATIRNEMADLEDMGYIEQLHTSSGRKPSDKGYRLYVDQLMELIALSPQEEFLIKKHLFDMALYEVDKIIKQATTLLSELTKLTSIVKAPSVKKSYLKLIQLVRIDEGDILAVIVTDDGIIKNSIIRVKKPIAVSSLEKLTQLLNYRLKGLTVEQINLEVINNLKGDLAGHEDIFNAIIPALYETLSSVESEEVYSQGTTNIFNYPEYNNIDKARAFLGLMNDEAILTNLLTVGQLHSNIRVTIGEENFLKDAKDCSIVSATYSLRGRPLGTIGVIGPTRMPYGKVISILTHVVKELNENIHQIYLKDNGG